jgi:hypothetical protein
MPYKIILTNPFIETFQNSRKTRNFPRKWFFLQSGGWVCGWVQVRVNEHGWWYLHLCEQI